MPRRAHTPPEPFAAREDLERAWFRRTRPMPEIADLVTGEQLALEPFHRWLHYKQAFAPRLVRLFLAQAENLAREAGPVLDPFAGSGTVPIECARRDTPAIGVEATASLAFLARARGAGSCPPPPSLRGAATWQDLAERFVEPIHRAALMIAVARRHTSDGKPLRQAPPFRETLEQVFELIASDLQQPLPRPVDARHGDALHLTEIEDATVSGVLSSPPYLSRHDYTRITRAPEAVHAAWYAADSLEQRRLTQVRAHPRAMAADWSGQPMPAAVEECVAALRQLEQPRAAGVVHSYFENLRSALAEMARVLAAGAPAWIVIGGARFENVYVPSDLIAAQMGAALGLQTRSIRIARRLTTTGRRLGSLEDVAPRESLLILRRD